jgi:hypothetical protein
MPTLHINKRAFQELVRLASVESLEIRREAIKVAAVLKQLDQKLKLPSWDISSFNNDIILLKTFFNELKQLWRACPLHLHCIGLMELKIINGDIYVLAACDRERIEIIEREYKS